MPVSRLKKNMPCLGKEAGHCFLLSRDGNGSRTEAGVESQECESLGLRLVELRDFVNLCG